MEANCQHLVSLLEHERFDGFNAIIQILTASLLFRYEILTNGTLESIRGGGGGVIDGRETIRFSRSTPFHEVALSRFPVS